MEADEARTRALDAAEELFYRRGVQAVGMDEVRAASGVSLKRLYQLFPTKEQLVVQYLARRDTRWRGSLAAFADAAASPRERVAAVFDWLGRWFGEADFRGCAWINAFGELGTGSPAILEEVHRHKAAFRAYLGGLVDAAGPEHDADLGGLADPTDPGYGADPGGPGGTGEMGGTSRTSRTSSTSEPTALTALADQLHLLAEGAMTTAAITGTPAPAAVAKHAALALFDQAVATR